MKVACAVNEEAGEGGSGDTSKVANKKLQAAPPANGANASQALRDSPDVGAAGANSRNRQEEEHDAQGARGINGGGGKEREAHAGTNDDGFTNAGGRGAGDHPEIGEFSGDSRGRRAREKHGATYQRHFAQGKVAFADKIEWQPGDQKIETVVTTE